MYKFPWMNQNKKNTRAVGQKDVCRVLLLSSGCMCVCVLFVHIFYISVRLDY